MADQLHGRPTGGDELSLKLSTKTVVSKHAILRDFQLQRVSDVCDVREVTWTRHRVVAVDEFENRFCRKDHSAVIRG